MLATFSVTNLTDGPVSSVGDLPGSLRQAVFDANDSPGPDLIDFPNGLSGSIELRHGELLLSESVQIAGPGPETLIVDAGHGSDDEPNSGDGTRLFLIDDGDSSSLSAIAISGLTLTGADYAFDGGAIFSKENLSLIDTVLSGNSAFLKGGAVYSQLENGASLNITGSSFLANSANYGGGLYVNSLDGSLEVSQSTFSNNIANQQGGGLYLRNNGSIATLSDNQFIGNDAISNDGGGAYLFSFGSAAETTISSSNFANNTAERTGSGAHLRVDGGASTIFEGNTVSGNTSFGLNAADSQYGGGLALQLLDDLGSGGSLLVLNSTITGNTSLGSGGGVYVYAETGLVPEIRHSTIAFNAADSSDSGERGGGGIYTNGSSTDLLLRHTIVAKNIVSQTANDLDSKDSVFTFHGIYTLVENLGTAVITGSTNILGADPLLGALADNGGPTRTHALLYGSPAIDSGNHFVSGGYPFDQRGVPFNRMHNGRLDIGAYEEQPNAPAWADFDDNHSVNGADFLVWQRGFGNGSTKSGGDINDDGNVDAHDLEIWNNTFGSILFAALANDTAPLSTTNDDLLTSDATISGVFKDSLGFSTLHASVDGGSEIQVAVNANGTFSFDPGLPDDGSLDGAHEVLLVARDDFGNENSTSVSFVLDTLAPASASFSLDTSSRLDPVNPALTAFDQVTLTGTTDAGELVILQPNNLMTIAAGDGSFNFSGLPVAGGLNPFTSRVEDQAGNSSLFNLSVTRIDVATDPFNGDDIQLAESNNWLDEQAFLIELGQAEGSRILSFDVTTVFDTTDVDVLVGDLLQVYLVDPLNPGNTLLDRGREGEALFSLSEAGADYLPGLVTFDGVTVAIDLSSLVTETEGLLVFQLVNGDSDNATAATISSLTNNVDPEGVASPVPQASLVLAVAGAEIDLSTYSIINDDSIDVTVSNVRVDGEAATYIADLSLRNTGPAISRGLVVRFNNLPDGVSLANASGIDAAGNPYLNLSSAVSSGGLDAGAVTLPVELVISNPTLTRFELEVEILSAGPTRAPSFSAIPDQTVLPGETLNVPLLASDLDGDDVNFRLIPTPGLPNSKLHGDQLTLTPTPGQLGSTQVTVLASDGLLTTQQTFTLNVVADGVTTTRLSGRILDSDGVTPLVGVPVELNGVTSQTDGSGFFTVEVGSLTGEDAVKVRADEANVPGKVYPFVAEKLKLVLSQGPFDNINNVIARPIYLPALDVAGGTTIDPAINVTVEQEIAPGEMADVFVEQGSLLMDDGVGGMVPFTGVLSITEVPPDLTPAALPPNLLPDVLVTIQPGEMVFTTPAPLTLPNRAGFDPDTLMDLWSIDPITGTFVIVGEGKVTADGTSIETISGGIISSSWHGFVRGPAAPTNPRDNFKNPVPDCVECQAKAPLTSEVTLHSGALNESHELPTYQSLGETRAVQLVYDSHRADPRHIVHTRYDDVGFTPDGQRLVASLSFQIGDLEYQVPGSQPGTAGLSGGRHFWTVAASAEAALLADLSSFPTGAYEYELTSGILQNATGRFNGGTSTGVGRVLHINSVSSVFGAGWGLSGVQQIVENADGSLLLVNGDGGEVLYESPSVDGDGYVSPPGDFSTLVKNLDGSFTRTEKDQTVHQFDTAGRLSSVTDRNGNQTTHVYESGRLIRIVDPVGLETLFTYNPAGLVSAITDPANRMTMLEYDAAGNLTQITDPDNTTRNFGYDALHHMISETDKLGREEQTSYGFHGRVTGGTKRDGTTLQVQPVQTIGLFPASLTSNPATAPNAIPTVDSIAYFVDEDGNVTETLLDQAMQEIGARDSIGSIGSLERNDDNLITSTVDERGNPTQFNYDEHGNLIEVTDRISSGRDPSTSFLTSSVSTDRKPTSLDLVDLNLDGNLDIVTSNLGDSSAANVADDSVSVAIGQGDGTFLPPVSYPLLSSQVFSLTTADFNLDGFVDIATLHQSGITSILYGLGDGTLSTPTEYDFNGINFSYLETNDLNGDGYSDLVASVKNGFWVMMNDGSGGFLTRVGYNGGDLSTFNVDYPVKSLLTVDADGDTDIDIYQMDRNGFVIFLENDGNGVFQQVDTYVTGGEPLGLSVADFDGDGDQDLVALLKTLNNTTFSVLLNNSDGSLSAPTIYDIDLSGNFTTQSLDIATTDANLDGVPDIAINVGSSLREQGFRLVWALGNGDGSFQTPSSTELQTVVTGQLVFGDIDSDGDEDAVLARRAIGGVFSSNTSSVAISFNQQPFDRLEAFPLAWIQEVWPTGVIAGDLNNDGFPDAISRGNYSLPTRKVITYLGDGAGNFQRTGELLEPDGPAGIALGHFDDNDMLDLAIISGSAQNTRLRIYSGLGDGNFGTVPFQTLVPSGFHPSVSSIRVTDYDADGDDDIFLSGSLTSRVWVFTATGTGGFSQSSLGTAGNGVTRAELVDINSDENLDLAVASGLGASSVLEIFYGTSDGAFSNPPEAYPLSDSPLSLTSGDFNGNGFGDVAVSTLGNASTTGIFVFNGRAPRGEVIQDALLSGQTIAMGSRIESLETADFTGDGIPDLLLNYRFRSGLAVGQPDGQFSAPYSFTGGRNDNHEDTFAVADFNLDGAPDFLRATNEDFRVLYYENLGGSNQSALRFTYDSTFNQLASITDELDRLTLFGIDPATGNTLSQIQVIGDLDAPENGETDDLVTSFTYTTGGLIDTVTDPLGRVTDFDYDFDLAESNRGLLRRITFAVGTAEEAIQWFEYDAAGNQTAIIDENSNRTEFAYDVLNRLFQITEADPDGVGPIASPITTFDYDNKGNLTETVDAATSTTTNTYDAMDRLIRSVDDLSNETLFGYDFRGNLISVTDPNMLVTLNSYDARNRLVETRDPDGGRTRFNYDLSGNLIGVTDPVDNFTRFVYDARDRLTLEVDPLGAEKRFVYDVVDNLISQTDRNGRITQFIYDDVDRITTERWRNSDQSLANTITYDYDRASNLLSVVDAYSSLAFTYDRRDRIQTVDNAGTPEVPNVLLTYAYDHVGNVLSVAEMIAGTAGATTSYQYDALNRMTSVDQTGGGTSDKLVDLAYNQLGQFDLISRYSDLSRSNLVAESDYSYDALNRLQSLEHGSASGLRDLAFYDFEYDPASRIDAITDIDGRTDYTHDDRDQLSRADRDDLGDTRGDENYQYDANGNRVDTHLHGTGYVTGPANRLLSDGTHNYGYDEEGNMILRTEIATGDYREFEYDHRNRLNRVTDFSSGGVIVQEIDYTYDALDRRISRAVDADGAGVAFTEHFVYDGDDVLLDFVDTDGSGTIEQPVLSVRNLFGPGVDQVLAQENLHSSQTLWLLTDHLGTVRDIMDNAGSILNHILYDSFGNVVGQSDSLVATRYLFTGRELDASAGLYYYRARIYDASIGRFVSEDPIRFSGDDANLFRYVDNSTAQFTDPTGLKKKNTFGIPGPLDCFKGSDPTLDKIQVIQDCISGAAIGVPFGQPILGCILGTVTSQIPNPVPNPFCSDPIGPEVKFLPRIPDQPSCSKFGPINRFRSPRGPTISAGK